MYPLDQRDVSNICSSATYDFNDIIQKDRGGVGSVGGGGGMTQLLLGGQKCSIPLSPRRGCHETEKERGGNHTTITIADQSPTRDRNRSRSASMASVGSIQSNNKFENLNLTIDFTPAEYITLLFTDLGVLTPAAVSDELIRLYQ